METVIPIETTDEFLIGDGVRRVLSYKDKLDFPMRLYGRHIVKSKNIFRPSEWFRRNKDASMDDLPKALKEKIDSFVINEEDNPILIFYREKK